MNYRLKWFLQVPEIDYNRQTDRQAMISKVVMATEIKVRFLRIQIKDQII